MVHVGKRVCLAQRHLKFRQFTEQLIHIRQELMQRWIQQPDRYWKAGHLAKDPNEVPALQRQKFFQRLFARARAVSKNHLAHTRQALVAEEHVLSAT